MKIKEIYDILNQIAPFESQEKWDNSGVLIGNMQSEFERIYLSLDLDSELIDEVLPNSLIITHHPLIFRGLKNISLDAYPSSIIAKMITKNITLISMHTNYDKFVLNEYFTKDILGFDIVKKDDFLIYCDVDFKFSELVDFVKQKLDIKQIKTTFVKQDIKNVAICTGSGMDLLSMVKADVFLTGDIKYHQALEAKENGINLIDINHYESERYFGASLMKYLQNIKIKVIITNSKNPFVYC
ncbi:Nif3-like dinuclear metal center hexameric protein [Campylobacter pinnipediorum]|uniref:GTP cyclohydrolase 1 type 2 homolog n=1 Tax=Campylobacter pinnipediorum subsp. pinnipediorum TaxID=1660067 RepID=A0AAX0L8X9_9BACT|nr:Nif3-like dinuclear metal center hexameric protein [Campylobacter pinnipediorum]AQW80875.1 putative NIF3 domain protein [Campylobacter pinnipediorum subsp. pinnipediorum]AQW82494.1 putative NIF3 domain protein [Campylobacter pinnipediorum subsp. pinnipediorum]AQW84164.1 putative NIF3 domain protein [Campylobacter pinnipediorum subsp. pinnipediorum]OPA74533.1 Nif3-like dinuclear metal center hexameric protein [Campylobacter pinnipediorum subsp. pinnipediorum]OPA74872.1 Nif3-like dinuclear me